MSKAKWVTLDQQELSIDDLEKIKETPTSIPRARRNNEVPCKTCKHPFSNWASPEER